MKQSEILKQINEIREDVKNYNDMQRLLRDKDIKDLSVNISWYVPGKEKDDFIKCDYREIDIEISKEEVEKFVIQFFNVDHEVLKLKKTVEEKYEEAVNKLREFLKENLNE